LDSGTRFRYRPTSSWSGGAGRYEPSGMTAEARPIDFQAGPSRIDAEMVDIFHRNVPAAVLALNPVLAGLLTLPLYPHASLPLLSGWVGLLALVALLNGWRSVRYLRARLRPDFDHEVWGREFTRGAAMNGTAWGLGGALFYFSNAPLQSMFVLLVICGVAAGSVGSQSSLPRALHAFLLPAILIPAARVLGFFDWQHAILALLLVTYLAFLMFVARTTHQTVLDSVVLRFSNQTLLEALSERERHFRSLIENALDWVAVVGSDGKYLFLSPSLEELLGWTPEALRDQDALAHVHPEDRQVVQREFDRVFRDGGVAAVEARWRHRAGHWVLFQGLVRRLSGDTPALVMNARDVTERRAIERDLREAKEAAEAANRIKDQFLASMSHEIRTPLHAMQGMADLLRETPLSPRQHDYVDGFKHSLVHLTRLVNDVLDFSRMNAGRLVLSQEAFDLQAELEEVIALLAPQAAAKGLRLHLDWKLGIAPRRVGDAVRLRQVMVNLVGNAIKFTEQGEVRVKVTEHDGTLTFTVADTGRGITPEQQALLFRAFSQVDGSSTREFGGAGLGLAISRGLVEAMGGAIGVQSRPGEGSEFHFSVRLPKAEPAPAASAPVMPAAHLLFVDDAELNLSVLREFFRDTPCRIEFARNGREAVRAWERSRPDFILMDIQMPEMDGWEATRTIRDLELRHGCRPVPIVALTAGALDEDRDRSLAEGCTDFLTKPVSKERLISLIAAHLDEGRRERTFSG